MAIWESVADGMARAKVLRQERARFVQDSEKFGLRSKLGKLLATGSF